jgi:hypothetical protein
VTNVELVARAKNLHNTCDSENEADRFCHVAVIRVPSLCNFRACCAFI